MDRNVEYNELSRAKITDVRHIVISECSRGGFTIAQQVEVNEQGDKSFVFLKGAFHVKDRSGMEAFADAIAKAITNFDAKNEIDDEDEINWDESAIS